ncbi:MAG: NifB/NifX family molybdenum-iron cluster-binding protein [Sulfurospirillaceae bacterium]|jgi:predicted Fe-Mo cluster-binding NifX family protein|nr:NifB/NifX family molybdenum-iron cluster-binding protein [Sulfurospirillaceae bacterium]MDD2826098.1 NifB/NifX family molybdenum-iron cluster-binding protein [Sulfurospirillaceae bacterium]
MIAMPVKTDKEEAILAPLFGHAKYFAFSDEKENVTIHQNSADGGVKVVRFLADLGVKTVFLNHIGEKPFHLLLEQNIDVYFAGKERISFHEALEKFYQGALEKVTIKNYMSLLGDDEQHDHEDHHHGGCGCSH